MKITVWKIVIGSESENCNNQHRTSCEQADTELNSMKFMDKYNCEIEIFDSWFSRVNLDNQLEKVIIAHKVITSGVPNRYGVRYPLKTNWNIPLLASLLVDYHDMDIVEWLQFGFPISYKSEAPDLVPNSKNHKGALNFPDAIDRYVARELSEGSMFGPFTIPPFLSRIGVSPLSTRSKKDSVEKRVIMDLSFPLGNSVNDYISKTEYMGQQVEVKYPTIDTLAKRIAELGKNCLLYKRDLERYFRQIPVCPLDYSLLVWRWRGLLFFDCCMPMGLRSVVFIAQKITSSLAYIHHQAGYFP